MGEITGIGQLDENNLREQGLLIMYNPDGAINIDKLVENMRFSFFPDDPICFRYYKIEVPDIGIDTGGTAEEIMGKLREGEMSNLVRVRAWIWLDHKPGARRWGQETFEEIRSNRS